MNSNSRLYSGSRNAGPSDKNAIFLHTEGYHEGYGTGFDAGFAKAMELVARDPYTGIPHATNLDDQPGPGGYSSDNAYDASNPYATNTGGLPGPGRYNAYNAPNAKPPRRMSAEKAAKRARAIVEADADFFIGEGAYCVNGIWVRPEMSDVQAQEVGFSQADFEGWREARTNEQHRSRSSRGVDIPPEVTFCDFSWLAITMINSPFSDNGNAKKTSCVDDNLSDGINEEGDLNAEADPTRPQCFQPMSENPTRNSPEYKEHSMSFTEWLRSASTR